MTGLLVDVGDVDGMAQSICRLLGNENLRRQMGSAGHKRAREQFDVHGWANQLYKTYSAALG